MIHQIDVFGNRLVHVEDYGAAGDGVTDDTVAIQAALTAAAGVPLHFPPGAYKITGILRDHTKE